jgi:hypothetical protein
MPAANLDRLRRARPKLEKLGEIAAAARQVTSEIRTGFPMVGQPWVFEGSSDDPGVQVRVMNALGRLDRLQFPARPPFTSPDRESHVAYLQLMGKDCAGLGYFLPFVCAVMNCHRWVAEHYQAGGWVAADGAPGNPWPWNWRDLPPIPSRLLDALDKAAADLEGKVNEALAATGAPAPPAPESEPEGGWSRPDYPSRWAIVFNCKAATVVKRFKTGIIRNKRINNRCYQVALADIPAERRNDFRQPAK